MKRWCVLRKKDFSFCRKGFNKVFNGTFIDILAVHTGPKEIILNLSGRFADGLAAFSREEERAAVYAMVNTLTEGTENRRVIFFFEGEQRETLAGGLDMRGAFFRNPGMVVN